MERPCIGEPLLRELLERLYGLQVTSYKMLPSYDDKNYLIYPAHASENPFLPSPSTDGYVLKVLNSEDSKKVQFIDAMHAAIFRAAEDGLLTPRPVQNREGRHFSLETLPSTGQADGPTATFIVRLFEYVPGELLQGKPYTPGICHSVGAVAGRLDKAFQSFNHPGFNDHKRHWSLTEVVNLGNRLAAVTDTKDRQLIQEVIDAFRDNVATKYDVLQKGVIHADMNEGNIIVAMVTSRPGPDQRSTETFSRKHSADMNLNGQYNTQAANGDAKHTPGGTSQSMQNEVKVMEEVKVGQVSTETNYVDDKDVKDGETDTDYEVAAILDFGDAVHEFHVFEVAIAIMYMMNETVSFDPIEAGGHTLAGYLSQFHLPRVDLDLLKECVCGRFAQSFVYGAYEHMLQPDNTSCLRTAKRGWPLLRQLWRIEKADLYRRWQTTLAEYGLEVKLV